MVSFRGPARFIGFGALTVSLLVAALPSSSAAPLTAHTVAATGSRSGLEALATPSPQLLTVPEELAIGRQFALAVESQYPMMNDPILEDYVNHRGRLIAEHSSRPDIPYFFQVVDDPEINAFTLPGGYIFLNLGMIDAAETEAGMMGIIAHEVGHAAGRHFVDQYSRGFWADLASRIGLGSYPNYYAYMAGNLFGGAAFMKFGRDAEREADAFGYQFLINCGYDPTEMVRMFEILRNWYQRDPGLLEKLYASHPPTEERIANLKGYLVSNPPPPGLIRDTEVFRKIHARIEELYADQLKENRKDKSAGKKEEGEGEKGKKKKKKGDKQEKGGHDS
ncbi:MAG: M48 family metallopeptidase [Acidobacteriota bacterium]